MPKALLNHHSGYFIRLNNFKEGEENTVILQDFDFDVFAYFVESIYYGSCDYRDNLEDRSKIRGSAKAWVLGDYLDATEFKNLAMRNLHDAYFPSGRKDPKVDISANAIDFCCRNSPVDSPLQNLYLKLAIRWWHRIVVDCSIANCSEWSAIWDQYPSFRDDLRYWLNSKEEQRWEYRDSIDGFLETLTVTGEPAKTTD
jgi:hypothetical protein